MIRRDLLKGFLTGMAAAVMGRSAKSDIAPHSLPRTEPVKVLDPGIEVKPCRVMRKIRVTNYASGQPGVGIVAIKPKDGEECVITSFALYGPWAGIAFDEDVVMAPDDTILVYARYDDKRVKLPYDVIWDECNEPGKVTRSWQSVRV